MHRSIRLQLLIIVLAVAVPLLGLVLYAGYVEAQTEIAQAQANALDLAQLTAANTRQFLTEAEVALSHIAQRPLIKAMDPAQCDPFLRDFFGLFPAFIGLGIVDASGQILCASSIPADTPPPLVADRAWFQTVMRTEAFTVSDVQQGRVTDKWVSVLAYPVRGENNQLVGAITLPVDLIRYQVVLDDVTLASGVIITIVDSTGTVVARSSEPEKWVGKNVRGQEIIDRILAEEQGYAQTIGLDGVEKLHGFTTIPGTSWHVYVSIPTAVAFAPVRSLLIRQAVLVAAIVLLVAFLAWYLLWEIERPIRALVQVARSVSEGNVNTRASTMGPAEFAEVARQFNQMLDAQAQHRAELERYAQQLQRLTQQVISVQEEERARLARELHDEAGQALTSLKISLQLLIMELPDELEGELSTDSLHTRVNQLIELTNQTMEQLRLLSHDLHPPLLGHLGLNAALQEFCRDFAGRTQLSIIYSGQNLPPLPKTVGISFFRFLQEALTNVVKHAKAEKVHVSLKLTGDVLSLEVKDDGQGFDWQTRDQDLSRPNGFGLLGMQERFRLLSGNLQIESRSENGTRLVAQCRVDLEQPHSLQAG